MAASPAEPLPALRVAAGVKTVIELDAEVDKASVQVDPTRVRLVDVGGRALFFETLVTPGEKEHWEVSVRYADGARPEWATFALVAHPTEMDTWVEATRPSRRWQPARSSWPWRRRAVSQGVRRCGCWRTG